MRFLLVLLGHASVAVGVVGVFVPLLPTTPFLLLAAALYARGSEPLHERLLAHPRLGPPVRAWLEHGVVGRRAKGISVALITLSVSYPVLFREFSPVLKGVAVATGAAVIVFLLTRPSSPRPAAGAPAERTETTPPGAP